MNGQRIRLPATGQDGYYLLGSGDLIDRLPPCAHGSVTSTGAFEAVMNPTFFETPAAFRDWLTKNHATADVLLVSFYKKGSKRPGITWPESVDEALCFGWIDGQRKGIDAESYMIRFTPRKAVSTWSTVNVDRVQALIALGRMQPSGLAAFEKRQENRSGIYSHEQPDAELPEACQTMLRENPAAWEFFQEQPASYRKAASWWISTAKKGDTRQKRIDKLIEHSARAERLPQFTSKKPAT